ncbi:MFS transporter [Streptomyces sp. KK5PA1]|uniref:MFS transporter n=2 Tax=Actinacidiphila acididurans TaxID=2784346 RepID=A0ABS2TR53_9ACTN|nr:MFS transporter [Actinacidiphila acididurans]
MLAMALAALDSTVISTAVPQIVGDLGGFSLFSWLFSGYLLAVTVALPVYGKLADSFGRKPVLITGITLFLVGSVLCAGAWNMAALIAFRVVQGLGGGAIQGTVQTIAADLYGLRERGRIQAALSSVWATAAVAGPLLGGFLAGYADWRWIFLVNVPIGAAALALILRHLTEIRPHSDRRRTADDGARDGEGDGVRAKAGVRDGVRERPRVDWAGAAGLFVTGGLLLFALVQGGVAWPWLSWPSAGLLAGSVLAGAVTVAVEQRAAEPVIPGWVWRRRQIASVNLAMAALGVLMVAPTVFLPTYAQDVLGLGPIAAGFVLSTMTLSWPISAALSPRVYLRIGFRNCALIGVSCAALVLAGFQLLPYAGPGWQPAGLMLVLGMVLGLFQLPLIVGVQSSVGWSERATATSSILFCRQVGQSVGAALFGAVANATLAHRLGGSGASLDDLGGTVLSDAARHAVSAAVDHVFVGAAVAALFAVAVLALLAPRRFPVIAQDEPARRHDQPQPAGPDRPLDGDPAARTQGPGPDA